MLIELNKINKLLQKNIICIDINIFFYKVICLLKRKARKIFLGCETINDLEFRIKKLATKILQ